MLLKGHIQLLRASCIGIFPRPTLNLLIRLCQHWIEPRVANKVPRRAIWPTIKRRMESNIFSKWQIYMIAHWRSCKVIWTRSRVTWSRIMFMLCNDRGRRVKQISFRWLGWTLGGIRRIRHTCSTIISFRFVRCWRIRRDSKRKRLLKHIRALKCRVLFSLRWTRPQRKKHSSRK